MNRRVLVIGPEFYGYNQSVARGFEQLGWTAQTINFYAKYPPGLKNGLSCGLLGRLGIDHFTKMYDGVVNARIIRAYDDFKPDLVFVILGNKLTRPTLEHLSSAKLVLWMMGTILRFDETKNNIDSYDHVFCFDKTDVDILADEGIQSHFLPLAVDESVYFPVDTPERDIDILFVGELYKERLEILEKIIEDFPGLKTVIFGRYLHWKIPDSYRRAGKYLTKRLHRYFLNRNIAPKDVNILYSRAKICLNIHHAQSRYGCNQRFFEIQGAKSFEVVDSNPYVEENFKGRVAIYKDYSELKDVLKEYLSDEEKRRQTAESSYVDVVKNHRFVNRIARVLEFAGY